MVQLQISKLTEMAMSDEDDDVRSAVLKTLESLVQKGLLNLPLIRYLINASRHCSRHDHTCVAKYP